MVLLLFYGLKLLYFSFFPLFLTLPLCSFISYPSYFLCTLLFSSLPYTLRCMVIALCSTLCSMLYVSALRPWFYALRYELLCTLLRQIQSQCHPQCQNHV